MTTTTPRTAEACLTGLPDDKRAALQKVLQVLGKRMPEVDEDARRR